MKNETVRRKKGFSFLSFILGILLGIVLVIGSVIGTIVFVLTADLDSVFNVANIENKNEDGEYVFINTDSANGGAKNTLELVNKLAGMANNAGELTLGEIETLFPIVSTSVVDSLYNAIFPYFKFDIETLRALPFSELGEWLQETIFSIQPARLIDNLGDGIELAEIVDVLLRGVEAKTVTVNSSTYPIYYQSFTTGNSSDYQEYLSEQSDGSYRLYFYVKGGKAVIVTESDGSYTVTTQTYDEYSQDSATPTGNYYYSNGVQIDINPVTLRSLMTDPTAPLNGIYIIDLFGAMDDALVEELLGGVTVGDLLNGNINFTDIVNDLEIATLIEVNPEESVMMYLAYGVSGVSKAEGNGYTGVYELENGETVTAYITVDANGGIQKVYYFDGTKEVEIKGTTVSGVSERIDGISVTVFLDATADDAILSYLGYGVYDIKRAEEGETYSHTASYQLDDDNNVTAYIETNGEGVISSVYYYDADGAKVYIGGTGINEISDRISGITEVLSLADIIDVTAPTETERNAIMVYFAYSVYDIEIGEDGVVAGKYKAADGDEKTCTLVLEGGVVTDAYYMEGDVKVYVPKTKVGDVNAQINGLTSALKIKDIVDVGDSGILKALGDSTIDNLETAVNGLKLGEIMELDEGDTVLYALKDSTVESLATDIASLSINQLYAEDIYEGALVAISHEGETTYYALAYSYSSNENYYTVTTDSEDGGVTVSAASSVTTDDFESGVYYVQVNSQDGKLYQVTSTTFSAQYVYYYYDNDGKLTLAGTEGKLSAYNDDHMYYTYGAPTSFWKLLLYVTPEGETESTENVYYVNNMTEMIENITSNFQNSTLRELNAAGVITFDDPKSLDTEVTYKEQQCKIGEMSLTDFLSYAISVAQTANNIPSVPGTN